MIKFLLVVLFFISNPAFSKQLSLIEHIGRTHLSGSFVDISHYCHLNTVYLSLSETRTEALTLVWNSNSGQPLKCTEHSRHFEE